MLGLPGARGQRERATHAAWELSCPGRSAGSARMERSSDKLSSAAFDPSCALGMVTRLQPFSRGHARGYSGGGPAAAPAAFARCRPRPRPPRPPRPPPRPPPPPPSSGGAPLPPPGCACGSACCSSRPVGLGCMRDGGRVRVQNGCHARAGLQSSRSRRSSFKRLAAVDPRSQRPRPNLVCSKPGPHALRLAASLGRLRKACGA